MSPLKAVVRRIASLEPVVRSRTLAGVLVLAMGVAIATPTLAGPAMAAQGVAKLVDENHSRILGIDNVIRDLRHGLQAIATADLDALDVEAKAGLLKDMAAAISDAAVVPALSKNMEEPFRIGIEKGIGAGLDEAGLVTGMEVAKLGRGDAKLASLRTEADSLKNKLTLQQRTLEARLLKATLDRIAYAQDMTDDEIQKSARETLSDDGVTPRKIGLTVFDLARSMNHATSAKAGILHQVAAGLAMWENTDNDDLAEVVRIEALEIATAGIADHLAAEKVLIGRMTEEDPQHAAHFLKASKAAGIADGTIGLIVTMLSDRHGSVRALHAAREAAESGAKAADEAVGDSIADIQPLTSAGRL
jgi:hypothetical protein